MTTFVANTNLIEITGLKSLVDGTFIDDADVTVTVIDAASEPVAGQAWPADMAYVDGSDGDYRAVLEDGADLVAGSRYTAVIEVDAGTDRIGHWEYVFTAKTRHGS